MKPASQPDTGTAHDDDVKVLHSMGYAQQLSRRMGVFSNFAISFSITVSYTHLTLPTILRV